MAPKPQENQEGRAIVSGDEAPSSSGIAGAGNDDDRTGGQGLASEFYKQLREREDEIMPTSQKNQKGKFTIPSDKSLSSTDIIEVGELEVVMAKTGGKRSERKFTGQRNNDEDSPASVGSFSSRGASIYSSTSARQPARDMMENEIRLVERAKKQIAIQAVVTLSFLVFAIYIGLTGGISSNDWSSIQDSLDTSIEGIEGVLPVPSDTSKSIWL